MKTSSIIILIILVLDSMVHIWATYREKKKIRSITKFFLAPFLMAVYLLDGTFDWRIFSAFCLFWIGDVALTHKTFIIFLMGGLSFLSANFIYANYFMVRINVFDLINLWFVVPLFFWTAVISRFAIHLYKRLDSGKANIIFGMQFYLISNFTVNISVFIYLLHNFCWQGYIWMLGSTCYMVSDLFLFECRLNRKGPNYELKHALEMLFYIMGISMMLVGFCV